MLTHHCCIFNVFLAELQSAIFSVYQVLHLQSQITETSENIYFSFYILFFFSSFQVWEVARLITLYIVSRCLTFLWSGFFSLSLQNGYNIFQHQFTAIFTRKFSQNPQSQLPFQSYWPELGHTSIPKPIHDKEKCHHCHCNWPRLIRISLELGLATTYS